MTHLGPLNLNGRTVRLVLEHGLIAAVKDTAEEAQAMVMPLLVEPHVHLDKTGTSHRTQPTKPGLFGAIEAIEADKLLWTTVDLRERIGRAMEEAFAAGVRAIRSHVDWSGPDAPLAWSILKEVAEEWRDRMPLQLASLIPIDILGEPDIAAQTAAQVARDGGVLGAFIYRQGNEEARIKAVFEAAAKFDLMLDFHVDEGLDLEADAFDLIVEETRRRGMAGRVLCGHACSLSIRPDRELKATAQAAAEAGVGLSVQPSANLFLQDMSDGRTPRLRGIAPVKELREAGVEVMFGTDNVRDAFIPFGQYDPLETLRLAWIGAQTPPDDWADAITNTPARALGLMPGRIAVGEPADFVVLDAPDLAAGLAAGTPHRQVWRHGTRIN